MTITAASGVRGAAAVEGSSKARRVPGPGGFSVPELPVPTPAPPAAHAAPSPHVGVLLALQEETAGVENARGRAEREARRHAHDLLRALSDLQRALLGAGDPEAALDRLEALAAIVPQEAAGPALADVIRSIRLRAALELHRLQPFSTGREG